MLLCHGWSIKPTLFHATKFTPKSDNRNGCLLKQNGDGDKNVMIRQMRRSVCSSVTLRMSADSDNDDVVVSSHLSSTYDVSLPANLRGEAVRSALRSDRGVCYNLSCSKMSERNIEVLRLKGAGTISFLNSKLSSSFTPDNGYEEGSFQKSCLLSRKGHVMDVLTVLMISSEEAIIMTSPGNDGLFDQLDPLIFPMDQVKLTKITDAQVITMGTAHTNMGHIQSSIQKFVFPFLIQGQDEIIQFPDSNQFYSGLHPPTSMNWYILPDTFLPKCAVKGYTFLMLPTSTNNNDDEKNMSVANSIWNRLIAEDNMEGPVHLGPLEFETLRIEAGQPAYGFEMSKSKKFAPTELYFHQPPFNLLKDVTTKGCFLGQEAVSAALGNPRGPPRSLYSVVFEHEDNTYHFEEDQGPNYSSPNKIDNLTRLPKVNDSLYVLGSNEQISVGKITSVAEMGGTSNDETVCLAIIKRADSIRKQMLDKDMEEWDPYFDMNEFNDDDDDDDDDDQSSGMLPPPPRDPLHGLEVIIGGTMTYGTLRVLPWRRLIHDGQNIFQEGTWKTSNQAFDDDPSSVMGFVPTPGIIEEANNFSKQVSGKAQFDNEVDIVEDLESENEIDDDATLQKAVEQAEKDAKKAADEAKRKEEKLKLLKQRADAALEARRKKKEEADNAKANAISKKNSDAEAEAKRKEEKLKMLKARAEAAMAARKKKKEQS